MQTSLCGTYTNDFNLFGRTWQVKVQADQAERGTINDIYRVRVRSSSGELVPLQAVADLEVSERDARLTALPKAGATILPALSELAARQGLKLKELHLESGRLDEVFRTITA